MIGFSHTTIYPKPDRFNPVTYKMMIDPEKKKFMIEGEAKTGAYFFI
jgi:hypothetical protein